MFLIASVILFRGRGSASMVGCIQGGLPPGGSASGGSHYIGVCIGRRGGGLGRPHLILWDTVNEWVLRILLECIKLLKLTSMEM